jgi:hypothetical protein
LRSPKPWRKHPPVDNIRIVGGARLSGTVQISPRGALRAREADARLGARARPARRALRPRQGLAARRLRHRGAPIDQHLKGLEAMGATIRSTHGYVHAECKRLRGARSTSTCHGHGHREPDDGRRARQGPHHAGRTPRGSPRSKSSAGCSTRWAPKVDGAGTDVIHIEGRRRAAARRSRDHPRPHRGGYLHGRGRGHGRRRARRGRDPSSTSSRSWPSFAPRRGGRAARAGIRVRSAGPPLGRGHHDGAAPGLPHRHAGAVHGADVPRAGHQRITETIFENRFMHVPELSRMGADIEVARARRTSTGRPGALRRRGDGHRPARERLAS